jgi:hypothetical protein
MEGSFEIRVLIDHDGFCAKLRVDIDESSQ